MKIGGIQNLSLIDYPGKISIVLFTQGCNFKCIYCHNPQLVYPELFETPVCENEIFSLIDQRKNKIEGIVISGGEPTIHSDLPEFINKIKAFNLPVKLDTNGSNPGMLKELLDNNLVDYVAMDVKAGLEKYNLVCGIEVNIQSVLNSIKILNSSSISLQYRVTIINNFHHEEDLRSIKEFTGCNLKLQSYNHHEKIYNPILDKQNEFDPAKINELNKTINIVS
jgi:pyruvate formate lyase activating enzyme